ncbi:NADP-dependent oxidoreductase [Novosphingobium umbonatum]|uniref:NADP-dependent oxidoreductase n=1 Tax=Novosphingobium umbonatum TaxID=1908524 RepID=A0A437N786_9SPHN|nr:NADP-dependent oxidoreductase [Novosphingobium umbonatum]RVU05747.1 NADP-dependent oxidoreductase [Novosphingobium umbonatum]
MTRNHYWRLDQHPVGHDFASALSLQEETPAPLAEGEVRIAVDYLSMDAGTRLWMTGRTDGYQPPLPLGARMVGLVLGRVVESRDAAFAVGDLVRGFGQWATLATVVPAMAGLEKLDDSVPDIRQHFGTLGLNAWTAYIGVVDVAQLLAGQWLAVSAAAGSTGLMACQIARQLGAKVVAIAGGERKCRYLREELGVDLALDYRKDDVAARLQAIDGGLSAYFDNVGGPLLDAVLPAMAHYGRIAICGMVAGYDGDRPLPGPARFDQILMRRLRVEGFFIPDNLARGESFPQVLRDWAMDGTLTMPFDQSEGIEQVLTAYGRMMSGANIGKTIVKVSA